MKKLLLKNWNLMRILRLAIGLWAIFVAYNERRFAIGLLGGLLIVMAIFNIGCCGVNGSCSTPISKQQQQKTKEISYEEIT